MLAWPGGWKARDSSDATPRRARNAGVGAYVVGLYWPRWPRPARAVSGTTGVRISRCMEVLALGGELVDQALELGQARVGGADGRTVLAALIATGLAGIEPILHRSGQQAIGDVPQVGLLVLAGQPVAEVHGLGERGIEGISGFIHDRLTHAALIVARSCRARCCSPTVRR